MATYTIRRGEQQFGPYQLDQVQEYFEAGRLLPTDLVWQDGATAWEPLSGVVAGHSTPPPSPPPSPPPPMPSIPNAVPQSITAPAPDPTTQTELPKLWRIQNIAIGAGIVLTVINVVYPTVIGVLTRTAAWIAAGVVRVKYTKRAQAAGLKDTYQYAVTFFLVAVIPIVWAAFDSSDAGIPKE